jgi:hypothetical protein
MREFYEYLFSSGIVEAGPQTANRQIIGDTGTNMKLEGFASMEGVFGGIGMHTGNVDSPMRRYHLV